jgi:hypothetical protein
MTPAYAAAAAQGGNILTRAEAWLDAKGRGAWIVAMILGFVFFWPVGLALVAYMTVTGKWSKGKSRKRGPILAMSRGTGNAAFDSYKADMLRRLEDEQAAFEEFLERLREAKDKAEFDQFMDERSKRDATDADRKQDA